MVCETPETRHAPDAAGSEKRSERGGKGREEKAACGRPAGKETGRTRRIYPEIYIYIYLLAPGAGRTGAGSAAGAASRSLKEPRSRAREPTEPERSRRAGMDMMLLVQGACCSNQWLAAVLLSLCCLLPSCLPAGQSVDFRGTAVDSLVVRKGDTAVLRCYLEDGASKGAWLNRSSIIFAGGDKWSVDPRVSIATANKREYSLQIQDVDVSDDGPYTCSVQTQHTPRTMQVYLTVKVSPKISHISNDIVVNEGSNVTLACLATGKPDPSISWKHISPSAKPFENGQYLDIYGITRDQAGEYECSAENDISVPDVKKVKVTVNFSPTIQEIKSSGVTLGGPGFIRCESAGVPSPTFEWYKGERRLINGQQGITIKSYSSRSFLNFNNVTEEHFGNYTCVAANKLGTTNASLLLNPPSTTQLGITGSAEVLLSCWYLVLTLSSYTSIMYLKNIILQ